MARRRVTIKYIDPWSVLKFGFLASITGLLVLLLAAVVAWYFVRRLEVIETACGLAETVGIDQCGVDGAALFRVVATLGALGAIVVTGLLVFSAFLANLITDLTGGVELNLADDTPQSSTVAARQGSAASQGRSGRTGADGATGLDIGAGAGAAVAAGKVAAGRAAAVGRAAAERAAETVRGARRGGDDPSSNGSPSTDAATRTDARMTAGSSAATATGRRRGEDGPPEPPPRQWPGDRLFGGDGDQPDRTDEG